MIKALVMETKTNKLIYGTKDGMIGVLDMSENWADICCFKRGSSVTCAGCVDELIVVGWEDGAILWIRGDDPVNESGELEAEHKVKCLGIVEDMVVVGGETRLTVWGAS
jgi:hypothetical protein